MNVAFLTHEPFYPPSGGGSAEAVYLIRELVQRGHAVRVFCPKLAEPEWVQKEFGVRLHEFRAWQMGRYTSLRSAKYLLYPFLLRRMAEAAHREEPFDLVLSQHAISAVAAGWLKRRLRVAVAMNFLDYLTGFMETWPAYLAPRPLLKRLEKFEISLPLRSGADAVLTVSDTLADYFVRAGYPRGRVLPIYYGYDADLFPFSKERETQSHPKAPTIVMHGSLDHHHLGPIALHAIDRVVRERPDVVFRFVGQRTGSLENFLQRVRAQIPAVHVESTGFVPYRNVAAHLADASAGIVPYEESTGTHCAFVAKIVEYLAVGLPVVSTPLDSARRYFGHEPRVRFSGFDGESFGEKILSWLRQADGSQPSRAQAASERVRAELDWRVISKKAIDFVEGIRMTGG
jgi:glycosyltransferase involved in cell wall biosynthesis